jgi:hypothetical protein
MKVIGAALIVSAMLCISSGIALAQGGGSGNSSGPDGAGPDNAATFDQRYPGGVGAAGPARDQHSPAADETRTTGQGFTGTDSKAGAAKAGPAPERPGSVPGQPSATPD